MVRAVVVVARRDVILISLSLSRYQVLSVSYDKNISIFFKIVMIDVLNNLEISIYTVEYCVYFRPPSRKSDCLREYSNS